MPRIEAASCPKEFLSLLNINTENYKFYLKLRFVRCSFRGITGNLFIAYVDFLGIFSMG
jgi:hypothetical protein